MLYELLAEKMLYGNYDVKRKPEMVSFFGVNLVFIELENT